VGHFSINQVAAVRVVALVVVVVVVVVVPARVLQLLSQNPNLLPTKQNHQQLLLIAVVVVRVRVNS
jgi:hypothetical protein